MLCISSSSNSFLGIWWWRILRRGKQARKSRNWAVKMKAFFKSKCDQNEDFLHFFILRLWDLKLILPILTWFFIFKAIKHTSVYPTYPFVSTLRGLEIRFEWQSLGLTWFYIIYYFPRQLIIPREESHLFPRSSRRIENR